MAKDFEEIIVDISVNNNIKDNHFYPFYVRRRSSCKSRTSVNADWYISDSLQSLHNRRNYRFVRRLVRKNGKSSIHRNTTNSHHFLRYLLDLSNTLLESSWKWTLLAVCFAFILTWLLFAGLWMVVSSDDIEDSDGGNQTSEPCLGGINGFAGYLLFSVETQSTIGYGSRYINGYCPEAVFLMCVQIIVGVCICGSLICIVYLKMVGPNKLHSMNCFSKFAVICQRDGELCLIFRVRDSANKYEGLTSITAYLVQKRNGELFLKSIKLDPVGMLIWPVEVVHKITKNSPFWELSANDLLIKRFEIIVVMDGTSLATDNMSRTTTSYLTREIKWGHRFTPCTTYDKEKSKYLVNHSLFNKTEEVVTPLCSGKKRREIYQELLSLGVPESSASLSTSKYSSPLFQDLKIFQTCNEEEEEEDENLSSTITTSAIVHVQHNGSKIEEKEHKENKGRETDGSISDSEHELTFQDLSLEDLTEKNVKSYNKGKTKDLVKSLQKFVIEDNARRLHLPNTKRTFNETSL